MAGSYVDKINVAEDRIKQLDTICKAISTGDPDTVRQQNDEANRVTRELEKTIISLEADARASGPSIKRQINESIAKLRDDVKNGKMKLQRANDAANSKSLLASSAQVPDKTRDRMVTTTEKAVRTTGALRDNYAILVETEEIGTNTVTQMVAQGQQIERTTGKIHSVKDEALIGKDKATQFANFAFSYIIIDRHAVAAIIVLLVAIGVVVYFGYIQK